MSRGEKGLIALCAVMAAAVLCALLVSCADFSRPAESELERQAADLFKGKRIYKDPDSNLCLIVLDGTFADRPVFETHLIRCKSVDHVLKPVTE